MSQRWRARCQIRARPWRGSVVRVVMEAGSGGLFKGLWGALSAALLE